VTSDPTTTSAKGRTPASDLDWTDLDRRTVDVARALAMDAVEQAGSGHPGTAMSLAPAATLLFQRLLRHDPSDPSWVGRDRFVLSCGHSSLTLYIQLYLSGYGLTLEDLRSLRQWDSLTPGTPSTATRSASRRPPARWARASRRRSAWPWRATRARALRPGDAAGRQRLRPHHLGLRLRRRHAGGHPPRGLEPGRPPAPRDLVVLYDDNTSRSTATPDVAVQRGRARRATRPYGWHTQRGGGLPRTSTRCTARWTAARDERDRPSIVPVRSDHRLPAPNAQYTGKAHGAASRVGGGAATK
jgi:transketolase